MTARPAPARVAALAVANAVLAGCIAIEHPDYPPYWPALTVEVKGCPVLDGRFEIRDLDERQPVPLLRWLLPWAPTAPNAARIELAGPQADSLTVRWIGADAAVLLERTLRADSDFRCDAGWLRLPQAPMSIPGLMSVHNARLARNARGDLVVMETDAGGGMALFLVPAYGSSRSWHAYRQFVPTPASTLP